jgi:hypothetical protein
MTKKEYRDEALRLYREKEKETGRQIIGSLERFFDYVDQEFKKGTPADKL